MKKILSLAFMALMFSLCAQTVDTYYNGSEPHAQFIYEFPTDPSRLLQCRYVPGNGQFSEYVLEEVTGGVLTPINVPQCTQITSAAVEVSGGLVFSGLTQNNGNELFFFDGVNSTLFDLSPGANGSVYIGFYNFEGDVYFTAHDGANNQGYKFVNSSTVQQFTMTTEFVNSICTVWGGAIYFGELSYDAVNSTYTNSLKKAVWNGIDYDYSLVREVETAVNLGFFWSEPVVNFGKLFIAETIVDRGLFGGNFTLVGRCFKCGFPFTVQYVDWPHFNIVSPGILDQL